MARHTTMHSCIGVAVDRPGPIEMELSGPLKVCISWCLYFIHFNRYSNAQCDTHLIESVCVHDGRSDPYSSTATRLRCPWLGRANQLPISGGCAPGRRCFYFLGVPIPI